MAKLRKKRAGISSGNITEVIDAAEAAAESGADQKYIDNPYNKDLDESINKAVAEAKSNKRKVEAADYADSKRDNPIKNLDRDTQEYARKYKDATIEPILTPEPQSKSQLKSKEEYESHPELLPAVIDAKFKASGGGSGSGSSGGSGSSSGSGNKGSNNDWKEKLKNQVSVIKKKYDNYQEGRKSKIPSDLNQNEFEKPLNISDSQADYYASLCGSTKSIKTLRLEYEELKNRANKIKSEYNVYSSDKDLKKSRQADLQKQLDALIIERGAVYDETPSDDLAKSERKASLTNLTNKISNLRSEVSQLESELGHTSIDYRFTQRESKFQNDWENLKSEFSNYYLKVTCGQKKDEKEHGWREFAKEFGENTSNMLNPVSINPVTDIVGYGGMTGKSAVGGINAITGGYKVSDTANSWTRTNVGDRQLVESLVNVRPNKMITPFGVPGTVGESNLQHQFQYSSPLRRIGVGDVTARGGYQLRLEDIHRKRKKSQPKIVRKKIVEKKIIEKKKVMGTNKALINAMATVRNQRLVNIKVPTIGIKNIKGASGEPSIKGIVVLNNAKESALSKTTLNLEMKGIKNIMVNAVNMTSKRAKPKKVKK